MSGIINTLEELCSFEISFFSLIYQMEAVFLILSKEWSNIDQNLCQESIAWQLVNLTQSSGCQRCWPLPRRTSVKSFKTLAWSWIARAGLWEAGCWVWVARVTRGNWWRIGRRCWCSSHTSSPLLVSFIRFTHFFFVILRDILGRSIFNISSLAISLSQNTDFSKIRLTLLTRHVNW